MRGNVALRRHSRKTALRHSISVSTSRGAIVLGSSNVRQIPQSRSGGTQLKAGQLCTHSCETVARRRRSRHSQHDLEVFMRKKLLRLSFAVLALATVVAAKPKPAMAFDGCPAFANIFGEPCSLYFDSGCANCTYYCTQLAQFFQGNFCAD
jgi:hypothetical protein